MPPNRDRLHDVTDNHNDNDVADNHDVTDNDVTDNRNVSADCSASSRPTRWIVEGWCPDADSAKRHELGGPTQRTGEMWWAIPSIGDWRKACQTNRRSFDLPARQYRKTTTGSLGEHHCNADKRSCDCSLQALST